MASSNKPIKTEKLDYLGDEWRDINDLQDFTVYFDEPKRLYILLTVLLYVLMVLMGIVLLYLIKPRLVQTSIFLYQLVTIGIIAVYAVIGFDFVHLFISAVFERKIIISRKDGIIPRQQLIPAVILLGKLLGISKDRISSSFMKFNNSLVKTRDHVKEILRPDQVLVLLPRCIQHFECAQVVTESIENCKGCGKCVIKDIGEITKEYGCHTSIETGGSGARRTIRKLKPEAIIAVACERELLSGVQDVPNTRILGIANRRPEGPCKNTIVSVEELRDCLQEFIHIEYRKAASD